MAIAVRSDRDCGDEPLYSIPQVQEAFEGTGISLLDQEGSSVRRDTLTFSSYEYAVVVATASDAEYFWTDGSQEAIARRGNVVVLRLLGSPTSAEKKSIRTALEALTDSAHVVRFVND